LKKQTTQKFCVDDIIEMLGYSRRWCSADWEDTADVVQFLIVIAQCATIARIYLLGFDV